jgi:hypothetical protein
MAYRRAAMGAAPNEEPKMNETTWTDRAELAVLVPLGECGRFDHDTMRRLWNLQSYLEGRRDREAAK